MDVLVVEDNRYDFDLIQRAIAASCENIDIKGFHCPHKAIDHIKTLSAAGDASAYPTFILLDYFLGDINALGFMAQVEGLAILQHAPVVMFSDLEDPRLIEQCLKSGVQSFTGKPSDMVEYRESIISIYNYWSNKENQEKYFKVVDIQKDDSSIEILDDLGLKVFIVDDSVAMCQALSRTLKRYNCPHVMSHNAEDGLAYLQNHSEEIDVMILDRLMPGMSGQEMLEAMAEMPIKDIPVIMFSGDDNPDHVQQAMAVKVHAYLSKYTDETLLISTLRDAAGRN